MHPILLAHGLFADRFNRQSFTKHGHAELGRQAPTPHLSTRTEKVENKVSWSQRLCDESVAVRKELRILGSKFPQTRKVESCKDVKQSQGSACQLLASSTHPLYRQGSLRSADDFSLGHIPGIMP